ncbi:hypothetical protein P3444_23740, partial [Vibrio parahaemolyticus]|nr:hypothetical protein [Vibrio parahaemolyticus]
MGVLPATELAIHPISILITSANGQDVGYIFVGSSAEFFLRFRPGVEWYVSALIRAVQTREGSDG